MKYNEDTFKAEVTKKHNGEIQIVSKFKGLMYPILCKDAYGVMRVNTARQLLHFRPDIKAALNKTEYFMSQLSDKYPDIANKIVPVSEYKTAQTKMLFNTKYGVVSVLPDNLLHGHRPNIRAAINRKEYFKNLLLFLYDYKYQFIITSTSRHKGTITLICPKHGKLIVDSDAIFLGRGCPQCSKTWLKTDTFYLIRLYNAGESFYKLGISYKLDDGSVRRFTEYKRMGYNIEILYTYTFEDVLECKEFEFKLKQLIKHNLYTPKMWKYKTSTETFHDSLLPTIKENLIYDIVSTSNENLSSDK